jgi:alpha-galactosidase
VPAGGVSPFPAFGDSSARLDGKRFDEAIIAPDNADIGYDLHGLYRTLTALVGLDERNQRGGSVSFVVSGDGRELWNSGEVEPGVAPLPVRIDITGVKRLVLRVNAASATRSDREAGWPVGPHGVWAMPRLAGLRNP